MVSSAHSLRIRTRRDQFSSTLGVLVLYVWRMTVSAEHCFFQCGIQNNIHSHIFRSFMHLLKIKLSCIFVKDCEPESCVSVHLEINDLASVLVLFSLLFFLATSTWILLCVGGVFVDSLWGVEQAEGCCAVCKAGFCPAAVQICCGPMCEKFRKTCF